MTKTFRTLHLIIIFIFFTVNASAQGWIITDTDGSKTLISDGWIKTIDPDGESYLSTFNIKTNRLIIINPDQEVYAEGTIEDYCAAIGTVEQQMKENMTEEQRMMMEEFLKSEESAEAPEVTIDKVGSEKIAGFLADKYRVTVDGELYEEIWLTSDSQLDELIKLSNEVEEMVGSMVNCSVYSVTGNEPESADVYEEMIRKGVELKSIDYEYGEAEVITHVASIERENIDESVFAPPEGYKKVSLSEILLMQ